MVNPRPFLIGAVRIVFLTGISISVAIISAVAQDGNTLGAAAVADGGATFRPDLAFDVVSIRPSADTALTSFEVSPKSDEYRAVGRSLGFTVEMAYFPIRMGSRDHVIGAPSWVWNDRYDFVGKVGEGDVPEWQHFSRRGFMAPNPMLQIMLQKALADRCKLVVRRVPAQIDGYALVVAKNGPNRKRFVESKLSDAIPDEAVPIALDGRMVGIVSRDNPVLHFYQTSMAAFVLEMSGPTAPIEDRTGLQGKYKFDLVRLGTDGVPSSDWYLASLGLKLIPAKISTVKIVIDHIERPSPN